MSSSRAPKSWWTERWISCLESLGWSTRLSRGRSYARTGRVRQIDVQPGKVRAAVQGTRLVPYRAEILIDVLDDDEWERVLDVLAGRAFFTAKLLAGEMPADIEEAFAAAEVKMFPASEVDLETACSCPDWANPCKHIAAVFYVLGAEFDRDPFLILKLRGRNKEQVVDALRRRRATAARRDATEAPVAPTEPAAPPELPLESFLGSFWQPGDAAAHVQTRAAPPPVALALLKRLGPPSFWLGGDALADLLASVYRLATKKSLEVAYGGEGLDDADG